VADHLHYCTIPSRATFAQPMAYQCWATISDSGSPPTEDLFSWSIVVNDA